MVTASNWQKSHKWNLHTGQSSQGVPGRIADVQSRAISSHTDEDEDVERDQVRDENISTPRRHHVSIEQCSQSSPHNRAVLDSLDPEVEGKDQEKDRNGFVVVASGDRPGDVTRGDSHKSSSKKAC